MVRNTTARTSWKLNGFQAALTMWNSFLEVIQFLCKKSTENSNLLVWLLSRVNLGSRRGGKLLCILLWKAILLSWSMYLPRLSVIRLERLLLLLLWPIIAARLLLLLLLSWLLYLWLLCGNLLWIS